MTDLASRAADERRHAARTLLRSPLVTGRSHPEEFRLIRRHAVELASQFQQLLGYRLVVESNFARLHKAGLGRGSGRRLTRSSGAPFTPRTYAYLALTLSVLTTAPEQLLFSELLARIRVAAAEAGIDLGDPNRGTEKRALVAALRQLNNWQILTEDDGSVEAYVGDERAEALLTIDREIARRTVSGPIGSAGGWEELIDRSAGSDLGPRHSVRRRLVETPVVYLDDLSDEERDWLRRNQRREQRVLEEALGLDAEIRAEGVGLFDPEEELTDLSFPATGTLSWLALLLLERLVTELRPDEPTISVPIPDSLVDGLIAELVERHGRAFAKDLLEDRGQLRESVLERLQAFRLVDRRENGWLLSAAAARYAPKVHL
ncbi:TIGR02678 family protein [Actinopolymorpha sp. NPDC004070]|uniref:TIGR02678 family protein n=1 Tax=Actinopolymorpha sp. NPDC004070 TaxID=3154548 RepID=UPI0033AFD9E3